MADDEWRQRIGETLPGALVEIPKEIAGEGAEIMLKDQPFLKRFALKGIRGLPGYIYDGIEIATAKDKGRATAGVAGGAVVGGLGGLSEARSARSPGRWLARRALSFSTTTRTTSRRGWRRGKPTSPSKPPRG